MKISTHPCSTTIRRWFSAPTKLVVETIPLPTHAATLASRLLTPRDERRRALQPRSCRLIQQPATKLSAVAFSIVTATMSLKVKTLMASFFPISQEPCHPAGQCVQHSSNTKCSPLDQPDVSQSLCTEQKQVIPKGEQELPTGSASFHPLG